MIERKYIASDGSELKPGMMVLVFHGDKGSYEDGTWFVDVFSHVESAGGRISYFCASGDYKVCIPLEGNEHLAGTNLSFKENTFDFRSDTNFCWGDEVSVSNDGKMWCNAIFICYGNDVRRFIVIEHGFISLTSWKMCKLVRKFQDSKKY